MVKQHAASRGDTGARPLQGVFLALLILAVDVQVAAVNLEEGEEGLTKILGVFKPKVPHNYRSYYNGARMGFKTHKYMRKFYHQYSGSTPVMIDTVRVQFPAGTTALLDVATVDITSMDAVEAASCVPATGAGVRGRVGLVRLLGRQGSTPVLDLPWATFLACPAAGGTSSAVRLGLAWGGQLVPRSDATIFSYSVEARPGPGGETSDDVAVAWFGPGRQQGRLTTPLVPVTLLPQNPTSSSFYHIKITNIMVAGVDIVGQQVGIGTSFAAYLTTTYPFSLLPPDIYDRLKAELVQRVQVATPPPPPNDPGQLCYFKQSITAVPDVAIVFDGGATMQLSQANLFVSGAQFDCLSILPATAGGFGGGAPVVGSALQRGRTMTIQVTAGRGTVTF